MVDVSDPERPRPVGWTGRPWSESWTWTEDIAVAPPFAFVTESLITVHEISRCRPRGPARRLR